MISEKELQLKIACSSIIILGVICMLSINFDLPAKTVICFLVGIVMTTGICAVIGK